MATTDYDSLSDRFERSPNIEPELEVAADVSDEVQDITEPERKTTDGVLDPHEKLKRIREMRDQ